MNEEPPIVYLPKLRPRPYQAEEHSLVKSHVRMAAVNAAAAAYHSVHPDGSGDISDLLAMAAKIEDWINRS